jgi:hypothetical protein
MNNIDRSDKILKSLKKFYIYLGQVIDKGSDNDINDLEYLHEIVDTFYSSGDSQEDENSKSMLENYNDISNNVYINDFNNLSISDDDNLSIGDDNKISISDDNFIEDTIISSKQIVSTDFIDDFYSNKLTSSNILIFNKESNYQNNFNHRFKNYFVY